MAFVHPDETTVREVRKQLESLGIASPSKARKADLVDLLNKTRFGSDSIVVGSGGDGGGGGGGLERKSSSSRVSPPRSSPSRLPSRSSPSHDEKKSAAAAAAAEPRERVWSVAMLRRLKQIYDPTPVLEDEPEWQKDDARWRYKPVEQRDVALAREKQTRSEDDADEERRIATQDATEAEQHGKPLPLVLPAGGSAYWQARDLNDPDSVCRSDVRPARNMIEWGAFWNLPPIATARFESSYFPRVVDRERGRVTDLPEGFFRARYRGTERDARIRSEPWELALDHERKLAHLYERYPRRWVDGRYTPTEDLDTVLAAYVASDKDRAAIRATLTERLGVATVGQLVALDRAQLALPNLRKAGLTSVLAAVALRALAAAEGFLRFVSDQRIKRCMVRS